jgi:peptidoglycan/LPS O-acetylase OafA/YrhL
MKSIAAANNAPGATHYRSLDGLRGLAAAMVAYGHAGYFGGAHPWVPPVAGCATIGVILFFFLSGFLMAHHYLPTAALGIFSGHALKYWAAFLLRRFVRVYPPYLFAPIVGYLLLMPRMPPDFGRTTQFADLSVFEALTNIATFKGELGIYWTIEVELFFYLLFPFTIILCLLVGRNARTLLALSLALMFLNHFRHGLAGLSWSVPLPGMWTGYLSIFLAGAFAAVVAKRISNMASGRPLPWNTLALISFAALALVVALVSRFSLPQASIWQLEWLFACLFLVIFVSLVGSDGIVVRILSSRLCVALGRVSYSLYLIHIIAYYFAIKYLPGGHRGMLAVLALVLLTPAYYLLFERPFVRLSKRIAVNATAARRGAIETGEALPRFDHPQGDEAGAPDR